MKTNPNTRWVLEHPTSGKHPRLGWEPLRFGKPVKGWRHYQEPTDLDEALRRLRNDVSWIPKGYPERIPRIRNLTTGEIIVGEIFF